MALLTIHELHRRAGNIDLSHWNAAETFSLMEATLLTVGADPLEWQNADIDKLRNMDHVNWKYAALLLRSLKEGACNGEVTCIDIYIRSYTDNWNNWVPELVDVLNLTSGQSTDVLEDMTKINRKSLYDWYKKKGLIQTQNRSTSNTINKSSKIIESSPVIIDDNPAQLALAPPSYLDPANPRYTAKLRAAVLAWEAVTEAPPGRTAKQGLTQWLEENAKELGLAHPDGTLMKGAITEAAIIANWQQKGGSPKTPE